MDQLSALMNSHNAAMNAQMSKYSDKIMVAEADKRKKDELLDTAGMELIQAGLGSGRLGKIGHHLLHHALGPEVMKHGDAIFDAVRAHQKGGLTGVVRHFATQRPSIPQDVLGRIFPNGQSDAIQSHIRATFANPEAAARALGGQHEAGTRARMAALRAAGSSRATSASSSNGSAIAAGWRNLKGKSRSLFEHATSSASDAATSGGRLGGAALAAAQEKARLAERAVGSSNFAGAAADAAAGAAAAPAALAQRAASVVESGTGSLQSGAAAVRERAASVVEGAGGAAAEAVAAAKRAADLKADLLKKRARSAGAATKQGAESTTAAVADERERVVRSAAGPQQVAEGARASGGSMDAANADFLLSPEELSRQSAAPAPSAGPSDPLDRSGNRIVPRKPRPVYRIPKAARIDPVQAKLAFDVKRKASVAALQKAKTAYASTLAAREPAETGRTSSWSVQRPSVGPATVKNKFLDGGSRSVRSVGSLNAGSVDISHLGGGLPTFEEATAAVRAAPQRLIQSLQQRFGGPRPPSSTSSTPAPARPKINFAQELPTLPSLEPRPAAIEQPEQEDIAPENDGLDYNSLRFENFGFGGGKFEDD
tara:strand:+ start:2766 stop:4559 length:1794 start_codon:yes stop_codon:yes gene_type:complete